MVKIILEMPLHSLTSYYYDNTSIYLGVYLLPLKQKDHPTTKENSRWVEIKQQGKIQKSELDPKHKVTSKCKKIHIMVSQNILKCFYSRYKRSDSFWLHLHTLWSFTFMNKMIMYYVYKFLKAFQQTLRF